MTAEAKASFRQRLQAGEPLVGTMLKTGTSQAAEILANVGFDFAVIDQEHSPLDRNSTDVILLAGRAVGVPILVRVPTPEGILPALDCGATGVVVPHVSNVAQAKQVSALCRYRGGKRGYATSTRAGGYTAIPMSRHVPEADAMVTMIAQIEDLSAVEEVDAIAAVEGVDSLFIGRNDLACAFGDDTVESPSVRRAVERIAEATRAAHKPLGVFVAGAAEIAWLKGLGATMFIYSSDHGLMRQGAIKALAETRAAIRG